jgi:acyl carrier protein
MIGKIKSAFSKALKVSEDQVSESTSMNDLKEWDSLNHLAVIIELEKSFETKFSPHEVVGLNSVEKILEVLKEKEAA